MKAVATNSSSRQMHVSHGWLAELTVVQLGNQVVLSHAMPGGNSYAIKLGADVAGLLGAELVGYSTKSALPEVLRSVGRLLADDAIGPH